MSAKPMRNRIAGAQVTATQVATEKISARNAVREDDIRLRAYEIYLERGEQPRRELDDWLEAEREIEPA